MEFHEWWISALGAPPEGEEGKRLVRLGFAIWRAALTHGNREVEPASVEEALLRVGSGESNASDEHLLRIRIQVADETIAAQNEQLLTVQARHAAQNAVQVAQSQFMPEGAQALGGKMWRCPRCRFIGGLKRTELSCRGCGYPGEDTRSWHKEDESDAEAEAS